MNDLSWRKSTLSTDNGGNCVEIAVLPLDAGRDVRTGETTVGGAQ